MKTPRKTSRTKVASPIPEVVVVVPPRSKNVVPASKPAVGVSGTRKAAKTRANDPTTRGAARKTSRTEIRAESVRHTPSRLTPQQAKRSRPAPGSRAAKPARKK